jgi:hypothetical protein
MLTLHRGVLVVLTGVGLVVAGAGVAPASVQAKNTKAEQSLVDNQVPPQTASTCSGNTKKEKKYLLKSFPDQKKNLAKIVASVSCFPAAQGSPDEVDYVQFGTLNSMLGVYQANVSYYNITTGQAAPNPTKDTCPQEGSYGPPPNNDAGRVVCAPSTSSHGSDLVWAKNAPKILSEAFLKTDPDGSVLLSWWHTTASGPEG